ncbi:hypothetical protein [Yoonia sp. 208BN28-4]|uniref:hypothetical protein n=1 Tax=Yoonia sp. 208BN28-4 TaxID=3126505 RepID=UPI0030B597DD
MLLSHARRFVFFPDPIDGSPILSGGFAPLTDTDLQDRARRGALFHSTMSPAEAEWAFDGAGYAFRTYLRVAVVQNPFVQMVKLYEKITATDQIWQARYKAGLGRPDFYRWLRGTRPNGMGAGSKHSPTWRRFGAWSARNWCGDYVSHVIRQEAMEEDLTAVLGILGVAPSFDKPLKSIKTDIDWESYYDERSIALMHHRYGWDLAQYGYRMPTHLCAG